MTAPTCPIWCTDPHAADWQVHSAYCGEVYLDDQFRLDVEIVQYADGTPAVVQLIEWFGTNTNTTSMTAGQALDLGRWLSAAGDILHAAQAHQTGEHS